MMDKTNTKFTSVERCVLLIMAPTLVAVIAIRMIIAYYIGVFNVPYILHLEAIIYASSIVILLLYKNKIDKYSAQNIIISLGIITAVAFVGVMFSDSTAAAVGKWFGTKDKKTETLQFLGWLISGFTAFFGLFVFNRRAASQDKTNELTAQRHVQDWDMAVAEQFAKERSHVQDQFKTAADHLSNTESVSGRIASFYEFFYLAENVPDRAKNIFGILCAHLRHIRNAKEPEQELTESQTLVDMLFSQKEETPFSKFDYDLQRVKLRGVDFRKMHKLNKEFDFSAADLREAVFDNMDLSGFNFREANLHNAKFWKADLQKAILLNADLSKTIMLEANLSGVNLLGTNLSGADLSKTTMSNVSFFIANLSGAKFFMANLSNADFFMANLSNAKFFMANLSGADLFVANLSGADLSSTDLSNANLCIANLSSADLSNANLSSANLSSADLSKAKNLESAILSGAKYNDDTIFPDGFSMPKDMVKIKRPSHGFSEDDSR